MPIVTVEIINFVPNACDCVNRIMEFFATRQQSGFPDPGPGTEVKCQCGVHYMLIENGYGSRNWEIVP